MEENNQNNEPPRQPHQLFSDHASEVGSVENDHPPVPPVPPLAALPSPVPPTAAQPIQPQPYSSPTYSTEPALHANPPASAGQIVLQWLTYAFWGWTVLAMSCLVATVLANLIKNADTGGFMPYGIAAVLVLLPIAIACDIFYTKQEPAKKTGAASVVMIIHAVLFALFGIGALIGIVISLVTMFTSSGDSSGSQVALFSTMIITVLYAVVFLRTINPARAPWIRRFFPIFMAVVVGIISVMAILGPLASARLTRNDRLISDNLTQVQQAVSSYSTTNSKLPEGLASLTLSGDAKKLVNDQLVTYKPNSKASSTDNSYSPYGGTSSPIRPVTKTYYYQLCVNYKKSSGNERNSYDYGSAEQAGTYQNYASTYTHPEGPVCYNLKTSPY